MLAAVGFECCFALVHLSLESEQGDGDESGDADAASELERFHQSAPARSATIRYQKVPITTPVRPTAAVRATFVSIDSHPIR
ncbi:hypothetical protein PT2222_250166 [Paraburkholderia tropica]